MAAEHPLQEEVAADKDVPRELAGLAEDARDRHRLGDHRHVARLAGPLVFVVAVEPLLIGHLFGEAANLFAVGIQGFCDQRVAGRAELRLSNVFRLHRREPFGRGLHHPRVSRLDRIRTVLLVLAARVRGIHQEVAGERIGGAELLRAHLVAHRAGHAVFRQAAAVSVRAERQVGEHLAAPAVHLRVVAHHRHVTARAGVFDGRRGRRVIHRLAPHARLPVGIA